MTPSPFSIKREPRLTGFFGFRDFPQWGFGIWAPEGGNFAGVCHAKRYADTNKRQDTFQA